MIKGKKLSILGDSISTYEGVSNNTSFNKTIGDNAVFYCEPFPLEATYWSRLINDLGLELCVNNSWSGGLLSGIDNPCSGVQRSKHLADNNGVKPDIIVIYMGVNDLSWGIDASIFGDAYRITLENIKNNYPDAKVFCMNIADRDPAFKNGATAYNNAISECVANAGENFVLVDLFNSEFKGRNYVVNSLDTLHPNVGGMKLIANIIAAKIKEKM